MAGPVDEMELKNHIPDVEISGQNAAWKSAGNAGFDLSEEGGFGLRNGAVKELHSRKMKFDNGLPDVELEIPNRDVQVDVEDESLNRLKTDIDRNDDDDVVESSDISINIPVMNINETDRNINELDLDMRQFNSGMFSDLSGVSQSGRISKGALCSKRES